MIYYIETVGSITIDISRIGTILSNSFFLIDHFVNRLYTDIFLNKKIKTTIYHTDSNFLIVLKMFLEEYGIDENSVEVINKNK